MATPFPTRGTNPWDTGLQSYIDAGAGSPVSSFGAVGTADDTTTFAAAIASGKPFIVLAGTYIVNGLTMNQAGQVMTLAPGATLKAKTAGAQTVLELTAAGAQVIGYGATIDGNSVGNSSGSTIYGHDVTGQAVRGITFVNCAGIGINMQSGTSTIADNTLTDCGNTAIFVSATSTTDMLAPKVIRNRVKNTTGAAAGNGIYLTNNSTHPVYRAEVSGNDVDLVSSSTAGIGITVFGGHVGATVTKNTTVGGSMGISIDHGSSCVVANNTVRGPATNGIEFAGPASSTCSGNAIDGNGVTVTGVSFANVTGGKNVLSGNTITNLSTLGTGTNGTGIFAQNAAGTQTTITGNSITAFVPIYCKQSGHAITGNNLTAANSAVAAVDLDGVTDTVVANNVASGFSSAVVNAFTGTMNGIVIGPNILTGGTPADLINGWTPGTNGTGSQLIRGNSASAGFSTPTVTASPYTYTNTSKARQVVYIRGGTVTVIARNATTVATASPSVVTVDPGETCVITYSVAPTVVVDSK